MNSIPSFYIVNTKAEGGFRNLSLIRLNLIITISPAFSDSLDEKVLKHRLHRFHNNCDIEFLSDSGFLFGSYSLNSC